jgi:hypothetical protein
MKNLITTIVLAISILSASAQSFDGVPIEGDLPTAVARFKAKGYTIDKYFERGVQMKGRVANNDIQLFIFTTPISKKIFKISAYLDTETSWYSLKATYDRMLEKLETKYGTPDEKKAEFITPYYYGDGYELQAVTLEKTSFYAYWFKRDNLSLGVEISKYKQVKLTYENDRMMDIKDAEQQKIDNNSF